MLNPIKLELSRTRKKNRALYKEPMESRESDNEMTEKGTLYNKSMGEGSEGSEIDKMKENIEREKSKKRLNTIVEKEEEVNVGGLDERQK
jgi:hypothetical protein